MGLSGKRDMQNDDIQDMKWIPIGRYAFYSLSTVSDCFCCFNMMKINCYVVMEMNKNDCPPWFFFLYSQKGQGLWILEIFVHLLSAWESYVNSIPLFLEEIKSIWIQVKMDRSKMLYFMTRWFSGDTFIVVSWQLHPLVAITFTSMIYLNACAMLLSLSLSGPSHKTNRSKMLLS